MPEYPVWFEDLSAEDMTAFFDVYQSVYQNNSKLRNIVFHGLRKEFKDGLYDINKFKDFLYSVFPLGEHLILFVPLHEMPLYINDVRLFYQLVSRWRLKIGR